MISGLQFLHHLLFVVAFLIAAPSSSAAPLTVTKNTLAAVPKEIRPAQIIVSPDQSRFAWISRDEDSLSLVVDGKKQKPYDWIVQGKADFTADSQHIVYAVRKRNKALMIVDGNESALADSIKDWLISPAGQHIAYAAAHNGRVHAILDNVPGPPFDFVQLHAMSASGTLAYLAVKSNQQFAIIDGNESKPYDLISDIRLSSNGRRFAFIASSNGQTQMIIDNNEPGPPFDTISPAVFSADGKHVGYLAARGGDHVAVTPIETKTYPGKLSNLSLSSDGSRHLFISTKDAKDTLYIDGNPGPTHPAITTARFSADGKHIAYIVQTPNGQTAFIDNQPGAHFDQIFALYPSPTGHSFAFIVQRNRKSLILLDEHESPEYDAILGRHSPYFLENGSVRFLVLKDGQIVQVTASR